jgi:hypothetical protein
LFTEEKCHFEEWGLPLNCIWYLGFEWTNFCHLGMMFNHEVNFLFTYNIHICKFLIFVLYFMNSRKQRFHTVQYSISRLYIREQRFLTFLTSCAMWHYCKIWKRFQDCFQQWHQSHKLRSFKRRVFRRRQHALVQR